MYSTPDYLGHAELALDNALSNGFDRRYTPGLETAAVLMMLEQLVNSRRRGP